MKKALISLALILFPVLLLSQEGKKLIIFHTNDLHSRLCGFSPESAYTPLQPRNDNTTGGFSRIEAVLKSEREKGEGIKLTVDPGDFLMGTLFHSLESETGFQLHLMKTMGYDLVCLGNHEFDFGPGKLAQIIEQANTRGNMPVILSGNAVFDPESPEDDGLEKLYVGKVLSGKLIMEKEGLKIGFFSVMGVDAVNVAPAAKPVTFLKQIPYARKMVEQLRADKCDIVICVSHSGVTKNKDGSWGGEDVELAKSVKGIDLIISGHTHTKLEKPVFVNGIPVVQAGENGQNLGRLTMIWKDGKLSFDNYTLFPVDDNITGDIETEKMIDAQKELINRQVLEPLGLDYIKTVAEANFLLECNQQGDFIGSNLGPLVADAIYYYVNKHSKTGCDVSLVSSGVIRDRIVPGTISAPDVFRVMALGSGKDNVPGYPLAKLYVTGKELKSILEILLVAYKSSVDYYCYYSGFRAEYNPKGMLLHKIRSIEIIHPDGSVVKVDFSKKNKTLYAVAANSYMLEFIGIIKKMSFGLINVAPKDAAGNLVTDMTNAVIDVNEYKEGVQEGKEWLALLEFISSMKDADSDQIPDIDRKYATPVHAFINVKQ